MLRTQRTCNSGRCRADSLHALHQSCASCMLRISARCQAHAMRQLHSESELPAPVQDVVDKFRHCTDAKQRYHMVLSYAEGLPPYPAEMRRSENRVMGCSAQTWIHAQLSSSGTVLLRAFSDSSITAGLAGVLISALFGLKPQEILDLHPASFLPSLGLGAAVVTPSRVHGLANLFETIKRRTQLLTSQLPSFPSLVISRNGVQAEGVFAEVQAQYLLPDQSQVQQLSSLLKHKKIGVVAHFYMDPQVQGVLSAAAERWPHIHISDSLVMADAAVSMAKAGCTSIAVLGVDFMSENVRAILDEGGLQHVKVYRMASADIGCSLAEAAESQQYLRYLQQAAATPSSLHVVYINTSLRTKAIAHSLVPTITCTSSNVVQTVLQAFAQVPEATVWYGPDTYMGCNLAQLFRQIAELPDEAIQQLHPAHTAATVAALLPRLKHYTAGTCIVHHIFGGATCELVRKAYNDAYLTAHFEVPGEMFTLATEAKARGMGVVGSTSNILDFIAGKVSAALQQPYGDRLRFVLGTEVGMITSIVRKVQDLLRSAARSDLEVEIVFPVNPSAITTKQQQVSAGPAELPTGLSVVPGPASGEGCSLEGGCASCPYMKMNTLAALMAVAQHIGDPTSEAMLQGFKPRAYADRINHKTLAQVGCIPILHMRYLTQNKTLSTELVDDIRCRQLAT